MRYHLTPELGLERMWRSWNPCALLVGMSNAGAAVENIAMVPQKMKPRKKKKHRSAT